MKDSREKTSVKRLENVRNHRQLGRERGREKESQLGIIDYKNFKGKDIMKSKSNIFQNFVFSSNSVIIDFPMIWSIWPGTPFLWPKDQKK